MLSILTNEFSFHYERAEAKRDIKIESEIRIKTEKVSEGFQPNSFQIKSEVGTDNQELNPPKQFLGSNDQPQHLNEIFNPSEFSFHYERAEAKTDIKIEGKIKIKAEKVSEVFQQNSFHIKSEVKIENRELNDYP